MGASGIPLSDALRLAVVGLLAAAFALAAAGKIRRWRTFVDYLAVPFGHHASPVAFGALGAEIGVVGATVASLVAPALLYPVGAVLMTFTGFYAYRLVTTEDSHCGCFGNAGAGAKASLDLLPPASLAALLRSAIQPTLVVIRNGSMLFAMFFVAVSSSPLVHPWAFWLVGVLVSYAAVALLVGAGLVASILHHQRLLAVQAHPLTALYAARFRPVGSCKQIGSFWPVHQQGIA
jgi:hypothetical protein